MENIEPVIVVGSTSEHKLKAVQNAARSLGLSAVVRGVKASSGINEQPVGIEEIRLGAQRRAYEARVLHRVNDDRAADIAIGIENGIIGTGSGRHIFDVAIVVVNMNAKQAIVISGGHQVDVTDMAEARGIGFRKKTVGAVTAERTGCDGTDPAAYYSGGSVTRAHLLEQAVKLALAQCFDGVTIA